MAGRYTQGRRGGWLALLLLLLTGTGTGTAAAQADVLSEQYTAPDRSFSIYFPAGWQVTEEAFYTSVAGGTPYGPVVLLAFRPGIVMLLAERRREPVAVLDHLQTLFPFITASAQATSIGGRAGAVAPADLGNGLTGFAFVTRMSDRRFGLIVALSSSEALPVHIPLIESIIRRYDTPGPALLNTRHLPALAQFAAGWEDIITALKAARVIGRDGRLLFYTDALTLTGPGTRLETPAADYPAGGVVMGGELAFAYTPGGAYESCSLLARIVRDEAGVVQQYLEVGLDNAGNLFYFDVYGGTAQDVFTETIVPAIPAGQVLRLLLIAEGGRMSLYLNGRRVVDNARVAARSGVYALILRAQQADTACRLRDVWAFATAGPLAGECQVQANGQVTRRAGPGLGYAVRGNVRSGEVRPVVAFAYDAADPALRWWKLADDSWVREDVVTAGGDCDRLPQEIRD